MCGRYVSRAEKQRIAETFHAKIVLEDYDPDFVPDWTPDYNVAPQTVNPIVKLNSETGERELTQMRWGLIPFWAKDAKLAYSTINARSETLATSAIYRAALKSRRCLVPADAFYEWQKLDAKNKQPYAIAMQDDSMFAIAGLWETWKDRATERQLYTYTIITTDPNELMEPIHNRMPAILEPQDYERWLDPAQLEKSASRPPLEVLRPYPAEKMKAWKVGKAVGNIRNHSADLLQSDEKELPVNLRLF